MTTNDNDIDPAEFYDNIQEDKDQCETNIIALLQGTTDLYENVQQVLDEFAWKVKRTSQVMVNAYNQDHPWWPFDPQDQSPLNKDEFNRLNDYNGGPFYVYQADYVVWMLHLQDRFNKYGYDREGVKDAHT
jgi:hypothetical protein